MSLEIEGTTEKRVHLDLTENELRFVLLIMRTRQDECRKVTGEYPIKYRQIYSDLDVRIEQLKTRMAKAL